MHLFAYGVNMNHAQMHQRCPGARFLCPAILHHYKLVFDGQSRLRPGATANIWPDQFGTVHGGLFEITDPDLLALDRFEGHPDIYRRREVLVVDDYHSATYQAQVYLRDPLAVGFPGPDYAAEMLQGAYDCRLPHFYIERVKSLAVFS